jgi:DNA modification methylase
MILIGDVRQRLAELPDCSVDCVVTSPPYWGLRDYGHDGQIGLEQAPDDYVAQMVAVFREVRRVLKDDGTLWLNLGDSYASGRKGQSKADTRCGKSRNTRHRKARHQSHSVNLHRHRDQA